MEPLKFDFDQIFNRIKSLLEIKNESDLARMFDIEPNKYHVWKRRNYVPIELIMAFCIEKGVSIDWVFFGKGQPLTTNSKLSTDERLEMAELQVTLLQITIEKKDQMDKNGFNEKLAKEIQAIRKATELLQRL